MACICTPSLAHPAKISLSLPSSFPSVSSPLRSIQSSAPHLCTLAIHEHTHQGGSLKRLCSLVCGWSVAINISASPVEELKASLALLGQKKRERVSFHHITPTPHSKKSKKAANLCPFPPSLLHSHIGCVQLTVFWLLFFPLLHMCSLHTHTYAHT